MEADKGQGGNHQSPLAYKGLVLNLKTLAAFANATEKKGKEKKGGKKQENPQFNEQLTEWWLNIGLNLDKDTVSFSEPVVFQKQYKRNGEIIKTNILFMHEIRQLFLEQEVYMYLGKEAACTWFIYE